MSWQFCQHCSLAVDTDEEPEVEPCCLCGKDLCHYCVHELESGEIVCPSGHDSLDLIVDERYNE